ncbi:MAG TPA: hypothetical protein VMV72_12940 [Verrucomicrobiae bacterium]|nr:hypothetical protein [Verrucomicrobiae bacterium]
MQPVNRWLIVRVCVTVFSFLSGLEGGGFTPGGNAPIDMEWRFFGILFAVVLIGAFCAIGGAYQTEGITAGWTKPSWFENPFARSQPLQSTHFVAMAAISEGLGDMLRGLVKLHHDRFPPPGIPLGFGLGLWIALRLALLCFHREPK